MNLAQTFYATNVARAAFYPEITLSGTIGWTNSGGGIVTNPGQWLLNALVSLTQPLFNRGANIANLKIAKTRQKEARIDYAAGAPAFANVFGERRIARASTHAPAIWKLSKWGGQMGDNVGFQPLLNSW